MQKIISKVIQAWLLVGTLDILTAFVQYYVKTAKGPSGVLKYIASAVFGTDAFNGGNEMIFWGLLFHYVVALVFTIIFFFLSATIPLFLKYRLLTAIVYGCFMWAIMQFVVLPLTKAPALPFTVSGTVTAILILIICIGIPLSFLTTKTTTSKSYNHGYDFKKTGR